MSDDASPSKPSTHRVPQDWQVEHASFIGYLRRRWDEALLVLLLAGMLLMVLYLVWPQSQLKLVLQPLPPSTVAASAMSSGLDTSASLLPGDEAEDVSSEALASSEASTKQTAKKPRRFPKHVKKSEHAPILNLNTASLAQLQLLPGLGPKMAQRVVDYRKAHGPFTDTAQIMDVKGIGKKKFEKLKPFLRL